MAIDTSNLAKPFVETWLEKCILKVNREWYVKFREAVDKNVWSLSFLLFLLFIIS
jgi:hypothetical protein